MYKKIQIEPTIKDIWSIPFDNLKLNEQTKNRCEELFCDDMDDNAIVIYSTSDDGIIVLGYYLLDDLNITQSSMYEQLKINTFVFSNKDKTADLKEIKCKHISIWTFDESLRNKEYLLHIFEVMTFGNNSYLLWCDGHNEIVFYPLSERYAAIEYFANAFLKE
jgi:hypothetical protein